MTPVPPRSLSAGLLLLCAACAPSPDERPPAVPTAAPTVAPGAAPAASLAPLAPIAPLTPIGAPDATLPVRLFIEQSAGAENARLSAVFAPAHPKVRACVPGSGGVIRLRVVGSPNGAQLSVEPSTTLGPRERRCVLEALSTVDVPSAAADPSPSAKPSGFTALFRIEW
jgi:hypothetical protein